MAKPVFLRKIEDKFRYLLSRLGKGKVEFVEIKKGKKYKVIFSLNEGEYLYRRESELFWALLSSLAKNHAFYFQRIEKKKQHNSKKGWHYKIMVTKKWRWISFCLFIFLFKKVKCYRSIYNMHSLGYIKIN